MNWFLSEGRLIRFSSFTVFYLAQGLPIGLISIALPAWLAEQQVSASSIASFIAITGLPWGFKLLAGPIMDRFSFLPMGRRRPWVIGSQLGLLAAIFLLAFIPDPINNLLALTSVAFLINVFAATQDVAVDGMAIDTLKEQERGSANAFMAFGQVLGYSLSGALCALMLVQFGLSGVALFLGSTLTPILMWSIFVRERPNEKILPWNEGKANKRSLDLRASSWLSIFNDLRRVLFLPASMALLAAALFWRMADGFYLVKTPLLIVQHLQFESTDYSYWTSIATAIAAVLGLAFGPIIDKVSAKRVFATSLICLSFIYAFFGLASAYWGLGSFLLVILFIHSLATQVIFISFIALHMSICWEKVSATQFAIFMAWSNLARSMGASLFGSVAYSFTNEQVYFCMASLTLMAGIIVVLVNVKSYKQTLEKITMRPSFD